MDGIGQPGITRISCKGGVRLIIPKSGDWFFEVFYNKKVEDNLYAYFHKDSFRLKYVGKGGNRTGRLTACPKRSWKKGKCTSALALISLRHPMTKLAWYKKECKSGALAKRRKSDVRKIASIVKAYDMAPVGQAPYPNYKAGLSKKRLVRPSEEELGEMVNVIISYGGFTLHSRDQEKFDYMLSKIYENDIPFKKHEKEIVRLYNIVAKKARIGQ